jgi:hypothetical protein
MIISHGSGSGFALDVIKAGNGEAIRVTKTSGSGNAMSITGGNFSAQAATFSGVVTTTPDAVINGVKIGRGSGNGANLRVGEETLNSNTTGILNTAIGTNALRNNTTGQSNTSTGYTALQLNTTGGQNTANGYAALQNNTTGSQNTAVGVVSLRDNTTGNQNTAVGILTLSENTTGNSNSAVGYGALTKNSTGFANAATGLESLSQNTTGYQNTATGVQSLNDNTTGNNNTAIGNRSAYKNTDGDENTAVGLNSLYSNTTGNQNTAVGFNSGALTNAGGSNETSSNSVYIGQDARSSASGNTNEIVIGSAGRGNGSNTVTIGNSSITDTYLRGTVQLTDTGTASSINIISDSTGNGAINIEKNTNGTGIRVSNAGIGQGIFANNSSTGTGILIGNTSTGKGLYIDNASGATGDPFVYTLGGAAFVKAKIDYLGNLTAVGGTLTGALNGTSAVFSSNVNIQKNGSGTVGSGGYYTLYNAATTDGMLWQLNASNNIDFWGLTSNSFTASPVITLTRTGAATFSSSVTAGGSSFFTTSNTLSTDILTVKGGGASGAFGFRVEAANGESIFRTNNFTYNVLMCENGGSVGIGTASPAATLDVNSGTTNIVAAFRSTDAGAFLAFADPDTTLDAGFPTSSCGVIGNNFLISTANTERMRITSGGNMGIGVPSFNSTNERLVVRGSSTTSSDSSLVVQNVDGSDLFKVRNDGLIFTGTSSASPYNNNTTGRSMVIEASGGLGYLVSTRESKANIQQITSIDFINQLNPVQFNYRKKDNETNEFTDELYENVNYGFIADEVESVNKELVFYNEDGSLAGVEYNNMIAILTKAIQELKTEIDSLKNQIK